MKQWISLLVIVATFSGCKTSSPKVNLDAIPVPLAQRAGTELPSVKIEVLPEKTETRSEPQTPDIRFAIEKNLIGKTEGEVKVLLGVPKEQQPFGCRTNVQDNDVEINVIGEQWSYEATVGNYSAEMDLCLFRGKVIAQQFQSRIDGNGRIDARTKNSTDHKLIRELLLDKTKTDRDLLMEEELIKKDEPKKDL